MLTPVTRIVATCLLGMVAYGVCQDQVSVRLSPEYFTVAHDPREVPFDDPTLMALGWGTRACAGPGAILGVVLALVSTAGRARPLTLRDLWPGLAAFFAVMAWTTLVCGVAGGWVAHTGGVRLGGYWGEAIAAERHTPFVAVACAHLGAYASGVAGGVALGVWAGLLRGARDRASRAASAG
ncbi:MAG: hypothetical protein ACRC33_28485 [Gemmataceae bacterium]